MLNPNFYFHNSLSRRVLQTTIWHYRCNVRYIPGINPVMRIENYEIRGLEERGRWFAQKGPSMLIHFFFESIFRMRFTTEFQKMFWFNVAKCDYFWNMSKRYLKFSWKPANLKSVEKSSFYLLLYLVNNFFFFFAFLNMIEFVLKTVVCWILGNESRRINID